MNWKAIFPNALTSLNLLMGIMAIVFTFNGHLSWAPWCIGIAAIADFLDGFVARLLGVSGAFGKQMDSLADAVTFGVAPGVMVMCLFLLVPFESVLNSFGYEAAVEFALDQWMLNLAGDSSDAPFFKEMSGQQMYLPFVALLIPVFSVLRLAKFNIDERQSDRFYGLPTPANALFFCSFVLIGAQAYEAGNATQIKIFEVLVNPMNLTILTLAFSLLMVVDIPLLALKFKRVDFQSNWSRYVLILVAVGLLLWIHVWSLPIIVFLYLILSFISEIFRKKQA